VGGSLYEGLPKLKGKTVFESFPTSASRLLGLPCLPAKRRAKQSDIDDRLILLTRRFPLVCQGRPTHDGIQSLVSGLAGIAYELGMSTCFDMAGAAPGLLEGIWREGFIVNPVSSPGWRLSLPVSPGVYRLSPQSCLR
jgi:hypothetical protein